jgi:hypothetical protein
LVGFLNSISKSKFELEQYDISMQNVKIPQEIVRFFLPQKYYENTMGEKNQTGQITPKFSTGIINPM